VTASSTAHRFAGFPAGARATVIPSVFFTEVLPSIEDADELRVTLYAFYALGRRKGFPRYLTRVELEAEGPLLAALGNGGDASAHDRLNRALDLAAARATLLRLDLEHAGRREALYFLNTPSSRRAIEQIRRGEADLGRPLPSPSAPPASERSNVFRLYEENVGPLTPLVAEDLKEAEELYPFEWLEEAFHEAAALNKRSWRYVSRILQRWATEGRKHETPGRDPAAEESIRARVLRRFDDLASR
jgi:DNA replication protein